MKDLLAKPRVIWIAYLVLLIPALYSVFFEEPCYLAAAFGVERANAALHWGASLMVLYFIAAIVAVFLKKKKLAIVLVIGAVVIFLSRSICSTLEYDESLAVLINSCS